MTVFDILNCILYTKNKDCMSNIDDEAEFNTYMINRWISMYSPDLANFVNETTNKYSCIFSTRKELFDFYVSIFPAVEFKKINYIKKPSKEKNKGDGKVNKNILIAKAREISAREVKSYEELVEIIN